eukprot:1841987-Karenia_brevis.AAC.1
MVSTEQPAQVECGYIGCTARIISRHVAFQVHEPGRRLKNSGSCAVHTQRTGLQHRQVREGFESAAEDRPGLSRATTAVDIGSCNHRILPSPQRVGCFSCIGIRICRICEAW